MAVSVSYLYVHGLKLAAHTGLLNGLQTGTLPSGKPMFLRAAGGRRFLELGDFYVNDDIGFSIHHGGTLQVEKRFARGFSFHGSYTFSKTINTSDSVANLADYDHARYSAPTGGRFLSVDPVIDLKVTPNRADCLGVRGIARGLAVEKGKAGRARAGHGRGTSGRGRTGARARHRVGDRR